jgi:hypothetical protein
MGRDIENYLGTYCSDKKCAGMHAQVIGFGKGHRATQSNGGTIGVKI